MLLLDSCEGDSNDNTFLGRELQVLPNMRFGMPKCDLSEDLTEQMSVVGNEMAPESSVLAKRPVP
jgi:hypothetical protein